MNNKASRIYGRAQRIEFFQKVIAVIVVILAIFLVILFITNHKGKVDDNVNFAYLRNYMEANGYVCTMIHENGGNCTLRSDNSTSTFIRYRDGFEFAIISSAYSLNIKYVSTDQTFTFSTTSSALAGYKGRNYTCTTKGTILDELDKCVDENNEELTSNAYIGVIEMAIKDLNNFVNSSGYDKKILIEKFEWQKK